MLFQAYGCPFSTVSSFKYLRRVLTVADDDWAVVISNLRKAQKRWAQISQIMGQEGENARVSGLINKSLVQAILIYGSETWVLMPWIFRPLEPSTTGWLVV